MKCQRQAANMDVSAVGVGRKNTSDRPRFGFGQFHLIQLLGQTGDTCEHRITLVFGDWAVSSSLLLSPLLSAPFC